MKFLLVISTIGLLALATGFFVRLWALELLISITPQLAVIFIAAFIGSAAYIQNKSRSSWKGFLTRHRFIAATIFMGSLAALFVLVYSLTAQLPTRTSPVDEGQKTVSFATYNVLYKNDDFTKAADYIKQQDIDFIFLQEIREFEVEEIRKQIDFPGGYLSEVPYTEFGTVGILSKLPINDISITQLVEGYAILRAEVEIEPGKMIALYGTHITPPFTEEKYDQSQDQIRLLADRIEQETLPVVLGGDFNTALYSPKLQEFNDRTASTLQPVSDFPWPLCSWKRYVPFLCMRIDHIYIPKNAVLHDTYVSPDLGSDHRMVVAEFSY